MDWWRGSSGILPDRKITSLFLSRSPGIPNVRLDDAALGTTIHLATHTSTSDDRLVAESFADGDSGGMVLEFEPSTGHGNLVPSLHASVDVSWISKFPSESERIAKGGSSYTVKGIEVVDGLQRVLLGDFK